MPGGGARTVPARPRSCRRDSGASRPPCRGVARAPRRASPRRARPFLKSVQAEHVVAVHVRPSRHVGARDAQRVGQVAIVVGEDHRHLAAVGHALRLRRGAPSRRTVPSARSASAGWPAAACRSAEQAVQRRRRHALDRARRERDRLVRATLRRARPRQAGEREMVVGERVERALVGARWRRRRRRARGARGRDARASRRAPRAPRARRSPPPARASRSPPRDRRAGPASPATRV